jgi:hypothetical protein
MRRTCARVGIQCARTTRTAALHAATKTAGMPAAWDTTMRSHAQALAVARPVGSALAVPMPVGDTARLALFELVSATSAVQLQGAIDTARPLLPQLHVQELALAMMRADHLQVRHEGFLMDAAWLILRHRPPVGADAHQLQGYHEQMAVATATMLRLVTKAGLTNDYQFMASALGRAAELAPFMHGASLGETMEALSSFNRVSFTYGEALAQREAGHAGEGAVVDERGSRDEPYASVLQPDARRGIDREDDATMRHATAATAAVARGDEDDLDSALDDAERVLAAACAADDVHPNLVDAVLDACEARLGALCEEANTVNRRIEGRQMARVTSDRAGGGRPGDVNGGGDEDVWLPSQAGGLLPRAVCVTPAAVRSVLHAFAKLGVRDATVVAAVAEQLRAIVLQHCFLASGSAPGPAPSSNQPQAASKSLLAVRGASGEWSVGPFMLTDLLEILAAGARVVPRVTDVLEPEAAKKTTAAERAAVALLLVQVVAPLLLALPFEHIARTEPNIILQLRGLCERMPTIADAHPKLWDRLRLAKANPNKRKPMAEGRKLGTLGDAALKREKQVRRKVIEDELPLRFRRPKDMLPALFVMRRGQRHLRGRQSGQPVAFEGSVKRPVKERFREWW